MDCVTGTGSSCLSYVYVYGRGSDGGDGIVRMGGREKCGEWGEGVHTEAVEYKDEALDGECLGPAYRFAGYTGYA